MAYLGATGFQASRGARAASVGDNRWEGQAALGGVSAGGLRTLDLNHFDLKSAYIAVARTNPVPGRIVRKLADTLTQGSSKGLLG